MRCSRHVFVMHLIPLLLAIAVYDYILCFSMEMRSIWCCLPTRLTLCNALYALCRLIVFMGCVMVWLPQKFDSVSAFHR